MKNTAISALLAICFWLFKDTTYDNITKAFIFSFLLLLAIISGYQSFAGKQVRRSRQRAASGMQSPALFALLAFCSWLLKDTTYDTLTKVIGFSFIALFGIVCSYDYFTGLKNVPEHVNNETP